MEVDDAPRQRPLVAAAGVDIGSAIIASMAVSPFILAIDRAIIEAASGTKALFPGIASSTLDMVRRPQRALLFNPAYWMVAGVYAVTYAVANGIDTLCDRYKASSAVHGAVTLLGTTASNTTACIAKDVAFTRMYGAAAAAGGSFPLTTISLFGLRDLTTIASAFTLPKVMAAGFVSTGILPDFKRAEATAQLVSPVGMQLVCAPLHLLALTYYNIPGASTVERAKAVARTTPATTLAFAIRIAPAFGIGCTVNSALTSYGHKATKAWYYASH